eukprot:scaffold13524_cov109-Isochrysis_galbana.AAC.4
MREHKLPARLSLTLRGPSGLRRTCRIRLPAPAPAQRSLMIHQYLIFYTMFLDFGAGTCWAGGCGYESRHADTRDRRPDTRPAPSVHPAAQQSGASSLTHLPHLSLERLKKRFVRIRARLHPPRSAFWLLPAPLPDLRASWRPETAASWSPRHPPAFMTPLLAPVAAVVFCQWPPSVSRAPARRTAGGSPPRRAPPAAEPPPVLATSLPPPAGRASAAAARRR